MPGPLDFLEYLNQKNGARMPQALDLTGMSSEPVSPLTVDAQVAMAANASADSAPPPATIPGAPGALAMPSFTPNLRLPASTDASLMAEYDSPENKALRAQIQDAFMKSKESQSQSINDLQGLLKNYQSKQTVDLKPILALADAWGDGESKLSQAYQSPDSPDERAYKIAQLQDMITKRKGDMSAADLNFLKSQMSDKMGLRLADQQQRNARYDATRGSKIMDAISEGVNKDVFGQGTPRDFGDTIETKFDLLQGNLGAGDWRSFMSGLGDFARTIASEKGVLTQEDIQRIQPRTLQNDMDKIERYLETSGNGPIPKEYIQPYIDIMNRARQKIATQKLNQLDRKEKEYATRPDYAPVMEDGGYGRQLFQRQRERLSNFANGNASSGGSEKPMGDGPQPGPSAGAKKVLSPAEWLQQQSSTRK